MPYEFNFSPKRGPPGDFKCTLTCTQCVQMKPNGERCKLRTCIGTPLCWIHLLYEQNLRILPTSDLGPKEKGLFAMNPKTDDDEIIFRRGDSIIDYFAQPVNREVLNKRYAEFTAPYAFEHWDAACLRGIGSIVNSPRSSIGQRSNARFVAGRKKTSPIRIEATRNIRNGDEIVAAYGSSYRFNEQVSVSTKVKSSRAKNRAPEVITQQELNTLISNRRLPSRK